MASSIETEKLKITFKVLLLLNYAVIVVLCWYLILTHFFRILQLLLRIRVPCSPLCHVIRAYATGTEHLAGPPMS